MKIAERLAKEFVDNLQHLQSNKGEGLSIGDIHGLFNHLRSGKRNQIYDGVQLLAGQIDRAKIEISHPHPETIPEDKIPDASMELDAVVQATEDATNRILDAAERIQNHSMEIGGEVGGKIMEEVTEIFEASNFQDITGQRIRKVINILLEIEKTVKEVMDAISDIVELESVAKQSGVNLDDDSHLMNGPQMESDAPSQEDIDRLFAEC